MRFVTLMIFCFVLLMSGTVFAQGDGPPAINYISADKVYISAGRKAGLIQGATVNVKRDGRLVAVLIADNVSSHSAACHIKEKFGEPKVGDRVHFERVSTEALESRVKPVESMTRRNVIKPRQQGGPPPKNVVRGSFAIQTYFTRDLGASSISTSQPAIIGRLVINNLYGTGAMFRFRHRTRWYHRSREIGAGIGTDEWSHRLTEFAILYRSRDGRLDMGIGRVISPYVNGMGYIDGAYFSRMISRHFRTGIVAGSEPDLIDSSIDFGRRKFGAFVAYERGSFGTQRFTSTFALSGAYDDGDISREFGYLQNTFSIARKLSLYQSVEVDLNRQWRKSFEDSRFSFSNLYIVANTTPVRFATLNFAYDARRNVRDSYSLATPDSLFDTNLYSGYNGGIAVRLPRSMSMRANAGVRYREDGLEMNRFYSVHANIRRFIVPTHTLALSMSMSETPFVKAYRPVVSYRFPATRKLRAALSFGGYIYENQSELTNYYAEVGGYRTLGRRYFLSGEFRQYFGGGFDSIQMFFELGLNI